MLCDNFQWLLKLNFGPRLFCSSWPVMTRRQIHYVSWCTTWLSTQRSVTKPCRKSMINLAGWVWNVLKLLISIKKYLLLLHISLYITYVCRMHIRCLAVVMLYFRNIRQIYKFMFEVIREFTWKKCRKLIDFPFLDFVENLTDDFTGILI